jgi:hypothetical protein
MTKIILSTTDKQPRGQVAIICEALQHKDGYTAQELLAETGGTTPHNSYSLGLIAERFGFKFETAPGSEYEDGLTRYFFTPKAAKAKAAATTAKKPAPKASTTTKAAAFVMKRPGKKQAKATRKAA